MASPHVAGVAALYLETNPGASPATVVQAIIDSASLNKITGAGTGSPNRLLYSLVTGPSPTPSPTPTPTPSPTPSPTPTPTPSPTPSPSPTPAPSFSLSVAGYKVKGLQTADLTWSGATTTSVVDIWRNNSLILTTTNDGVQKDNINSRGAGSYTYCVCQSGTQVCSNSVTVNLRDSHDFRRTGKGTDFRALSLFKLSRLRSGYKCARRVLGREDYFW